MPNITIRTRLMLILLFVSLLACVVLSFIGSNYGKEAISREVVSKLNVERIAKKNAIEKYLGDIGNFVEIMGQNQTIIDATIDFKNAFRSLQKEELNTECTVELANYYATYMDKLGQNLDIKKDISLYYPKSVEGCYLQYEYIVDNPNITGEKDKLTDADDNSEYSKVHANYHDYFNLMVKKFDFYDVFLVDLLTGDIIYTADKETDFATNLYAGPYRNSNLAELSRTLKTNNDLKTAMWVDFAPYRPSYGAPAGFVGVPLTQDGETVGALIFQLPVKQINTIMTGGQKWKENGLGESGETYLVGEDMYMRSISRFYLQDTLGFTNSLLTHGERKENIDKMYRFGTTIGQQKINTEAVREAISGKSGTKTIKDYRNLKVISSFSPLNLEGLNWVVVAEIDEDEAFLPIKAFNRRMLITTVILVLLVTLLSSLLSSRFVKPIEKLFTAFRKIIEGDTSHRFQITSNDEFGELGNSFNNMIEELEIRKKQIDQQVTDNERLLKNFIPGDFVERLKSGDRGFADEYQNVSLIIIDIVGFNSLSTQIGANKSVKMLNEIVVAFDDSALNNYVERLRTFGNYYLAACGLFEPRLDHAKRAVQFAREVRQLLFQINLNHRVQLDIQISVHSANVIAGIIGAERFSFDIWGTSVSRVFQMNQLGEKGEILVSKEVADQLNGFYAFEELKVKLKDDQEAYKLIDKISS